MSRSARTELFAKWLQGSLVMADMGLSAGGRWWVDGNNAKAGATAGYGRSPDKPFSTIAAALAAAVTHDRVYVLPDHAEAALTLAASFTFGVSGVEVIGLGRGTNRPSFVFTAAAGSVNMNATNCKLQNVRLTSYFTNGITAPINIAASGCEVDSCSFEETLSTQEMLAGIKIAAGCSQVRITNNTYNGIAGGRLVSFILAAGAADGLVIADNYLSCDASASVIDALTAKSLEVRILRNLVINLDTSAGLGISVKSDTTGFADGNRVVNLKNAVYGLVGAGMAYGLNYCSNALGASGVICPAVDNFPS